MQIVPGVGYGQRHTLFVHIYTARYVVAGVVKWVYIRFL